MAAQDKENKAVISDNFCDLATVTRPLSDSSWMVMLSAQHLSTLPSIYSKPFIHAAPTTAVLLLAQPHQLANDASTHKSPATNQLHLHIPLLPVPHPRNLGHPHLPLQLENTVHERLTRRRAPRHVDIHRHDPIAASHHAVRVVIVAAAVGTRAHGNDPARLGHLIVHLAQGRRHLVGQGAGDNHDIGLTGRGTENDAQTILIVTGRGEMHHFDGTASETKGHGPKGGLTTPVYDLVEGCAVLGVG